MSCQPDFDIASVKNGMMFYNPMSGSKYFYIGKIPDDKQHVFYNIDEMELIVYTEDYCYLLNYIASMEDIEKCLK